MRDGVQAAITNGLSAPGPESQKAIDLIKERSPGAATADDGTGRVVFAAPAGKTVTTTTAKRAIERAVTRIAKTPGVDSASDPYTSSGVSKNGRVAYTSAQFSTPEADVGRAQTDGIAAATAAAKAAGLEVEYGGSAAVHTSQPPIGEILGVGVALLVLVVTFGSLLAAGLPLLSALVGVGFGVLGVMLASAFTPLGSTTITLATMLGLAVGIDYTLFILSRHRTQVFDGMETRASIVEAVATTGSAVVFAGSTVVIALVALLVTGIPFLIQMGFAAAGTIALAVLLSLTLVPAVLSFAGPRATRGKNFSARLQDAARGGRPGLGARWIAVVMRTKWPAITC